MKVSDLSPKRREAYERITAYLKTNPNATGKEAATETGMDISAYYAARKLLTDGKLWERGEKPKKTRRSHTPSASKMFTLPVDEGAQTITRSFLLIGPTSELVQALRDLGGTR